MQRPEEITEVFLLNSCVENLNVTHFPRWRLVTCSAEVNLLESLSSFEDSERVKCPLPLVVSSTCLLIIFQITLGFVQIDLLSVLSR